MVIYCVGRTVKDHRDNQSGNPLQPLYGLLFSIAEGDLYIHHPTDIILHNTTFATPVVEHWLE